MCAVDVHLVGHGDAPAGQTGVDVAGLETEGPRERWPAFVGKSHILTATLVLLHPVQKRQLKLGHPGGQLGIVFALAHLGGHVSTHIGDTGVVLVGLVSHQQVRLRGLLPSEVFIMTCIKEMSLSELMASE